MLQTLIVGLGRSGRGLHVPVVCRARASDVSRHLFGRGPILALDPDASDPGVPGGAVLAASLEHAAAMTDPERTVVHLCTPPDSRVALVEDLARHGFRKLLVEKPLAIDVHDVAEIARLRRGWKLQLVVVAPWLASSLTARIEAVVAGRQLGALRTIYVVQRKPRFTRSLTPNGHPTAFDVEMPHSVGVALRLAGRASLHEAEWTDMRLDNVVLLRMGGARLVLSHDSGVRTQIRSDFTSPLRERRITLGFERGTLVGHYPASDGDHTAQMVTTDGLRASREVFPDDAMTALVVRAYHRFARAEPYDPELHLQGDVVRLLSEAKRHCERIDADRATVVELEAAGGRGAERRVG